MLPSLAFLDIRAKGERQQHARAVEAFRNWDLPERRQIFAGVRLAADAAPTGREASA